MIMTRSTLFSRRKALSSAGLGIASIVSMPRLKAAEMTASEKTNVETVNRFCATVAGHEIGNVLAFFDDNGAYRMSERQEPSKGRPAMSEKIGSYLNQVVKFEVLDTWARGPMVINERIDHFQGNALKSWHGVGVFFLRDGKIVEWYDYTISTERA
jgi:limonene-1,2-epoxide hydrolase